MKKKLFALIIFAFAAFPALAAEWQQTSEKQYIDISSIKQYNDPDTYGKRKYNRDEKEFWIKHLNDKDSLFTYLEKEYHKKVWYVLVKRIIDCNNKTWATKTVLVYDINNKMIAEEEAESIQREDIIPDTLADYTCNIVCGYLDTESEPEIGIGWFDNANAKDVINEIGSYCWYILKEEIKKHWKPSKNRENLECKIRVTIAKDGELLKINVVESSKNKKYDNEAVKAIKSSAPFKPLPEEYKGESIEMLFTFRI